MIDRWKAWLVAGGAVAWVAAACTPGSFEGACLWRHQGVEGCSEVDQKHCQGASSFTSYHRDQSCEDLGFSDECTTDEGEDFYCGGDIDAAGTGGSTGSTSSSSGAGAGNTTDCDGPHSSPSVGGSCNKVELVQCGTFQGEDATYLCDTDLCMWVLQEVCSCADPESDVFCEAGLGCRCGAVPN